MKGKVVIITGASSGIGKATAILLSREGAICVLLARNKIRLEEVAKECSSETFLLPHDLTEEIDYHSVLQEIVNEHGKIYGLVHSAGIEQTKLFQQTGKADFQQLFDIN